MTIRYSDTDVRRPCVTLFFLYLIVVSVDVNASSNGILGPVTETVVNFEVNGNPSQLHRAEFIYTENTRIATSFVGNYEVTSRVSGKPGYNYVATEVAAIPAFMTTYVQEACLVKDTKAFVEGRVSSDPSATSGTPVAFSTQSLSAARHGVSLQSSRQFQTTSVEISQSGRVGSVNRKLLQVAEVIAVVALGVATAALVVGTLALETARAVDRKVNALSDIVDHQGNTINDLKLRTDGLEKSAVETRQILSNVSSALATQQNSILENNLNINRTAKGLDALRIGTNQQFEDERARTAAGLSIVQSQIQALGTTVAPQFLAVYDRIGNVTKLLTDNVAKSFAYSQKLAQRILSLNNIVWEVINKRQLRAMVTGGVHSFIKGLPTTMFPLVTDPGVAPDPNAYAGSNARLLLETISYNYVSVPSSRRIVKREFHVYINTALGVDEARPYTTSENLMQLYGPSSCERSYCDPAEGTCPDSIDSSSTNVCGIWVEEVLTTCDAVSSFEWKTANTSETNINRQSPIVRSSYCTSSLVVNPVAVYRTAQAFNDRLVSMCKEPLATDTTGGAYFMVTTDNLNSIAYIEGPRTTTDCDIPLDGIIPKNNAQDAYTTPVFFTHVLLELGHTTALTNIFNAQMRLEGRIPGGLDFYQLPFTYTPTRREVVNGQTRVIYDGGAETVECYYATLLAASTVAIPVYSLIPWTDNLVSADVVVDTVQRVNPTAEDYNVNVASAAKQVNFDPEANFMLPSSLIYVGDLPALGSPTPSVLYDVPEELLTLAGGYTARKNKLTCYDMPAGTRTTEDLPTWTERNPRVFKASECGVSAATFAYRRVSDPEGYPLCDVTGGIPDEALLTGSIGGTVPVSCNGGFEWYDGYTTTASSPPTYNCTNSPDTGLLVATNGTLIGNPTMDFTENWALALVYWTQITSSVTRLFSYNTASTLLVVDGGDNIVITAAGSQSLSVPVYHANSDADTHVVFIRWIKSSTTLTVSVDGIEVARTTGWTASSNGGTVNGAYPAGIKILGTLTPGNNANAQAVKYYNSATTSSDANILNWSNCLYSFYAALQKCVPKKDIYQNSNTPKAISAPLIIAYQQPAAGCLPTTSAAPILLTDIRSSATAIFAQSSTFTLTFFLDHIGPGWTDLTIVDFSEFAGYQLQLSNSGGVWRLRMDSYASPGANAAVTVTPSLAGDVSHFIALVYNSGQLSVYVDTILAHQFTSVTFGSNVPLNFIVMHKLATMARYYSGYQLSSISMATTAQCDMPPGVTDVGLYRTPLATCEPDPILITNGYCRHPTMCNGHCEAWSTDINTERKTFTALSYQCNLGWKGTNCDVACPRVNGKGQCLPDLDILSTFNHTGSGLVVGASNCIRYKFFQFDCRVTNGLKVCSFFPRQYQIRVTLELPSGTILTKLVGGQCPEIPFVGTTDGSTLQVQLKNAGAQTLNLLLHVTNTPDQGLPDPACLRDDIMVIEPRLTQAYTLPACGNMTIQIKTLTGIDQQGAPAYDTVCTTLSGQSIQQSLANILDVTPQVNGAILIAADQTVGKLNTNSLDLMSVVFDLLKNQAIFSGATSQELSLIETYKSIASSALDPSKVKTTNFTEMFSGEVDVGGQTLRDLIGEVRNSTSTFPSRYNISVQLANIDHGVSNLVTLEVADAVIARLINASQNATDQAWAAFREIKLPDSSFPDVLKGIENEAGKIVGAIPGIGDLFGSGSDCGFLCKIGNKITEVLFVLMIVGAVVLVVYLAIKYGPGLIKSATAKKEGSTAKVSGKGSSHEHVRLIPHKSRSTKY
jgi:hypothetical protein